MQRVDGRREERSNLIIMVHMLSRIQILTSKITQVCQGICDIKLRWLLVTHSDKRPDNITTSILTNQNGCMDTLGLNRSRPETLGKHEGCAENGNNYAYNIPNCHELGNQDTTAS